MASKLSPDESIALIHENLQEVLRPEIIEDVIKKENRPLKIYWGKDTVSLLSCGLPLGTQEPFPIASKKQCFRCFPFMLTLFSHDTVVSLN